MPKTTTISRLPAPNSKINDTESESIQVLILLLGPTGVGKSTFINYAAGKEIARVNLRLTSSDLEVNQFVVEHPRKPYMRCVFVEPPGFDQCHVGDWDVLRAIINWLRNFKDENVKFGGILYLHDISEIRLKTSFGLHIIGCLTVPEPANRVCIASVKWEEHQNDSVFEERERDLMSTPQWVKLSSRSTSIHRFEDTKESAWTIVDRLLEQKLTDIIVIKRDLYEMYKRGLVNRGSKLRKWARGLFSKLFTYM